MLAMRYDANDVADGVTEVLAYGTAVVVEPSPSRQAFPEAPGKPHRARAARRIQVHANIGPARQRGQRMHAQALIVLHEPMQSHGIHRARRSPCTQRRLGLRAPATCRGKAGCAQQDAQIEYIP
ncbi:protein belonging to Uncharacterized protein family UPF0145, partial [mine drainage metagenome]